MIFKKKKSIPKSYLPKIKVLTNKLDFGNIVKESTNKHTIEFKLEKGYAYSKGLLKNQNIAIADTFLEKNSIFPEHIHLEWEMLIVYTGEINIFINKKLVKNLKPSNFYYIQPNIPHSVEAVETSKVVSITIPASEDFPEGGVFND